MILGTFGANAALGLVTATPESTAFWQNIWLVVSLGFALGYLGLVAAFLLGLPSFDPVPEEAGDAPEATEGNPGPDPGLAEPMAPDSAGSPGSAGS
jgi:hypothetical protein